ncbi:MAG TPA: succinylglutamate desuccinylase/aspartoacylase family protein, partial [Saprospiraceae bacterium]|nr:succinylglutamate desuccinylase/aspartoacylase family protein [Saprospiraceae bacterium]
MYKKTVLLFLLYISQNIIGQSNINRYNTIQLENFQLNEKYNFWLLISENSLHQSIDIPVILLKGKHDGPVIGITAAIHGDEINGTAITHSLLDQIDVSKLSGTIIAFPVLNPQGFLLNQRDDIYNTDLNRIFPGKANGTESEQFVWALKEKILPKLNFLIDIHTASFGRVNTMYVRSNLQNDTLAHMAKLFQPDIILDSREASAGIITSASKTLRQEATDRGIHCITLEAGDPLIIQKNMTN